MESIITLPFIARKKIFLCFLSWRVFICSGRAVYIYSNGERIELKSI